jgi:photosystem II stability/assembly factor-like uncharacterized protein
MMSADSFDRNSSDDIVLALAISPGVGASRTCFAARSSGLYRSDDGGATWQSTFGSLGMEPSPATTALAVSPRFDADRMLLAAIHGGVLRSFDGGHSWLAATLPPPPPVVSTLAVSPSFPDEGIAFACTLEDGIFRSEDRGSSWQSSNFGLLDLEVLSIAVSPSFTADQTIYAGTGTGLFRSNNGGRAWKEVEPAGEFGTILSLALSPRYHEDGVIFAGTEEHGLVRSDDCGQTWSPIIGGVISGPVLQVLATPDDPSAQTMLVLLEDEALVSRDGGDSWTGLPLEDQPTAPMTSVATPGHIDDPACVLVGFANGDVRRGSGSAL